MLNVIALGLVAALAYAVPSQEKRDVDTAYSYNGPEIPIGDLVDISVKGNGTGYRRLREPPAVRPHGEVTNNINVISTAFWPGGMNVHFQTPFGIGEDPRVFYGESKDKLKRVAKGTTHTYASPQGTAANPSATTAPRPALSRRSHSARSSSTKSPSLT